MEDYEEKIKALGALMEKLQPEGKYLPFTEKAYKRMVEVTEVFKLNVSVIRGKMKMGQHLSEERFQMAIEHLQQRGGEIDLLTLKEMKRARED